MIALVKISDFADVYAGGGAPQNANDFSEDGTPFLRAGSLPKLLHGTKESDLEKITNEVAKMHRLQLHKKGSVVFAKSGMSATKGHIYRLKNDCYVVNHLAVVKPNAICDGQYLEYALKQYSPTSLILDAAYPSIRLSDISDFKIPLPPLAQQLRIAAILDKAAEIKAKRELAIAKLDELARSTFVEMFGDCRRHKHLLTKQVKDVCEFKYGKPLPEQLRRIGDVNVYGSNGVVGKHDSAITLGETIVIGRKGSYGKINYSEKSCYPIDTTFYIDSTSTDQNIIWLRYALDTLGLDGMNKSAAVPGLSRDDAYRQMLYVPTLPQQIKFAKVVEEISKKIALQHLSAISINQLIDSLQHQAFTTGFGS